jgi:hypothetical protein
VGAIHNKVQDEQAVNILVELPEAARDWIRHHFRSSLQAVMTGIEIDQKQIILKATLHMMEDLDRIGC